MYIKLLMALMSGLLFSNLTFGQSVADVNQLTGAANVTIPVYTLQSGSVSLPISLVYNSGVKPLNTEGTAGIGWEINIGGKVSRSVRGLPDDVTKDGYGNSRIGWMINTNTAVDAINSFTIQNDAGTTCAKETSDINYINTNFPFNYDTEPDIFYVRAPGLSCQLIYNRNTGKFAPISFDDLLITFTTDSVSGLLNSFTIVNEHGIKYIFAASEKVMQDAVGSSPSYFTTLYKQYQYRIVFNDAWYLTSVTDPAENGFILTYKNDYVRGSTDPVSLYLPGATTSTLQYNIKRWVTTPKLDYIKSNNINTANQRLSFNWNDAYVRSIGGMGRDFQFEYSQVTYPGSNYNRYFLRSFFESGCSSPVNYKFAYAGETPTTNTSYFTTLLPDSTAVKIDYWGYATFNSNTSLQPKVWINPSNTSYQRYGLYHQNTGGGSYIYSSTNGNNRSAELTNFNVGNLTGITYASGGTTVITYEPNSYIDIPSNTVVSGGGIRVKQITDYDGTDATKNIVRNYAYTNPLTNLTSGKPVSLPLFAFTVPYSGTATGSSLWNNNTVLSDYDLSDEDHSILYGYFKVSQTGAGSTLSQYYLPATNWDNSSAPGCNSCTTADWSPSINFTARNNCSSVYGPVKNDIYSYPFIPNPNYDFERGLLQKVTSFNEAGSRVSETDYTYQRSFAPFVITAFKYDDNVNGGLLAKAYNKYKIFYNSSELTSTVTRIVFDSPSLTQAQSSTVNYVYGSSQHKLVTQQAVTNSDNSIVTTNIKYIKDYTAAAGSNLNVNAIYYLQQQNVNIPVETWQQVTRAGTIKTIGGDLTLFKGFTQGSKTLYQPSQQLKFMQPDGIIGFTPYAISGQAANADPNYIVNANYTSYDSNGYPQTADDGNKNIKTLVIDHSTGNPIATFNNAAYSEIAFSDFDTDIASPQTCNFTISGSQSFTATGSHTGNAYGLSPGQTITKTISIRNPKISNYIFSIWINAATAGNLNFTLSGGTASTLTKSYTASGWTYYEWKIPVNNSSSAFTISITSTQAIAIDDIIFYPDISRVGTAAYNYQGYLIAETNTNGISAYYEKDEWGRLLFQYDQDRNIIKKQSYFTSEDLIRGLLTPSVDVTSVQILVPKTFTANRYSCQNGVTYTWDFGDGTPLVTSLNGYTQTHTYSNTGTYTLTVTASHAVLGSKSSTQSITIPPPNLSPEVCLSGVQRWDVCTNKAVTIVTCGTNPSTSRTSYFTITSVGGSGYGALSYVWQLRYSGTTNWIDVGTGVQNVQDCGRDSRSYSIRCIVTSTSGQTGTSGMLNFTANPCEGGPKE